ncbi:hypothetical protein A9P82_00340 [Arachidicoccus ginsenosidimutans]|uniref:hypothetical protein n=1 Tax=Arachidicoccus sp. BS20 TaxID=1850526 RepID=UPI0007F145A5|nr:hypothetical protein [Arachidicoccus sp. BS20]ANI87903.1 hypothetical protein A9P82_00340 [Arachidicoccus sp. BS20]
MKKILAILCLIIFSFQVIPVKAVGKLLSSGQITEDVQHADTPVKQMTDDDSLSKFWTSHHYFAVSSPSSFSLSKRFYITDDALIKCHHLEVLLQPPNA